MDYIAHFFYTFVDYALGRKFNFLRLHKCQIELNHYYLQRPDFYIN